MREVSWPRLLYLVGLPEGRLACGLVERNLHDDDAAGVDYLGREVRPMRDGLRKRYLLRSWGQ